MRQQPDLDLSQALATYAEREILDVVAGAKAALLLGPGDDPVVAILQRKGYDVTLPPAAPGLSFDLIVALGGSTIGLRDDDLRWVAPRGRLILLAGQPSHTHERWLRARGFLVRLRALVDAATHEDWSATSPCVYDALLMTRRQSLR